MRNNLISNVSKIIRLFLVITFIVIIGSSTNVKTKQVDNINQNKVIDLSSMARKYQEDVDNDLYASLDTFVGSLSGYIANCPLCTGYLACTNEYVVGKPASYDDLDYGSVKVVASSRNLPCGSIIRFESSRISKEPIVAIVLDRGVLGNAIDLLTESYEYATTTVGRSTITYDVLRSGWIRGV